MVASAFSVAGRKPRAWGGERVRKRRRRGKGGEGRGGEGRGGEGRGGEGRGGRGGRGGGYLLEATVVIVVVTVAEEESFVLGKEGRLGKKNLKGGGREGGGNLVLGLSEVTKLQVEESPLFL